MTCIARSIFMVMLTLTLTTQAWAENITSWEERGDLAIGSSFLMTSHKGETFTDHDLKGKYSLVYFGFSHCPSACPTALLIMSDAYDLLPKDIQDEVQLYFISFDPARDSVERLSEYVPDFHESMIGLRGNREETFALIDRYEVTAGVTEKKGRGEYSFRHSTLTYLLDKDGQYLSHYTWGRKPAEMAKEIKLDIARDKKKD